MLYGLKYYQFQTTVFFKKEHFKTSLPVAITTMLVMYTLNQSISAKLPPTSYMKFIDVWLLFGLIQPFFIIIMVIVMEHLPEEASKQYSARKERQDLKDQLPTAVRIFAKICLPIIEVVFISLYMIAAVVYYFQ